MWCEEPINESLAMMVITVIIIYNTFNMNLQCLRMLARLNYIMGDHVEAMSCQQKAVLMSERVNGKKLPAEKLDL